MNSLFLLLIALVVFAFGYRFYAKLLALTLYRTDSNYSTTATRGAVEREAVVSHRQLAFGHHFAAIAGVSTVAGVAIAVVWGWIPAFLWVVVGTAVTAGTFSFGALWIARQYAAPEPSGLATAILGPRARPMFLFLAFTVMAIMNAVVVLIVAQLLTSYPYAALAFWFQVLIALVLGRHLHQRVQPRLAYATLIAVAAALASIWFFADYLFAFSGALNIDILGDSLVSIDASVVWIVLLLVYLYYAIRLPLTKLMQPRGYLTAVQTGLAMLMFMAGLAVLHPSMIAPEFTEADDLPATIPWLFITVTSGAIAGFHLLIAGGITSRQVAHDSDVKYIGFGAVLAEGLLAVIAIIICATVFAGQDEWRQFYRSWEHVQDLELMTAVFINGFAYYLEALGLSEALASVFAAVTVLGLAVTTLEACMRIQKQLLSEVVPDHDQDAPHDQKKLLLMTIGLTAVLAMYNGTGTGGLAFWPLFGVANQFLAVTGLLMILLAAKNQQRPVLLVAAPLLFLVAVSLWALAALLEQWWNAGEWMLLAASLLLFGALVQIGLEGLKILLQWEPARPKT